MRRIYCTEELHNAGGPGTFLLCRAETAAERLLPDYKGKVQLIYLDPPFGTGDTFSLRRKAGGRAITLPVFADIRCGDDYVAWMRKILIDCHALLAPTGSLYLHIDYRMNARMRLLLDEIFGSANFMNEIVWCYRSGGRSTRYFPRKHDNILFYRKSRKVSFDISAVGTPRGPEKRNHMKRFVDDAGRVCFSIRTGGKTYVYYEDTPAYPSDVWTDIEHLQQKDPERTGYATQKPLALLRRIVSASSKPGDLVLDLFSGSGTTAAAAAMLGRRYLVSDASPIALYTLRGRQLNNAGTASLLDTPHEMLLSYPECRDDAVLALAVTEANGRRALRIDHAYFEKNVPIVYAAVGAVDGKRFLPFASDTNPLLPLSLPLPTDGAPVVQLVDARGRQAFFLLEESDLC